MRFYYGRPLARLSLSRLVASLNRGEYTAQRASAQLEQRARSEKICGDPPLPCGSAHARDRPQGFSFMNEKLLLVDDDPAVRRMLLRVLNQENYLVRPASSGAEALMVAAGETFGLLLLDINLPGENGWEVCGQFVKAHPDLPIIVITARSNQVFPALASEVGALLEKPLDIIKLLRTIRALLEDKVAHNLAGSTGQPAQIP